MPITAKVIAFLGSDNVRSLVSPPVNLTAKAGSGQVTLNWLGSPTQGVTRYRIYRDNVYITDAAASARSYLMTGLNNGQTYSFTMDALRETDASPKTSPVNATPTQSVEVILPPTNVSANPGDGVVNVSWTPSTTVGVTAVRVYLGSSILTSIPVGTTSYAVTGLVNGQSYSFRLDAIKNSLASEQTEVITVTPTASLEVIQPPTNVAGTPADASVELTWTKSPTTGVTGYEIYLFGQYAMSVGDVNNTVVTGLTNGVQYNIKVVTVKGSERSDINYSRLYQTTPVAAGGGGDGGPVITDPSGRRFGIAYRNLSSPLIDPDFKLDNVSDTTLKNLFSCVIKDHNTEMAQPRPSDNTKMSVTSGQSFKSCCREALSRNGWSHVSGLLLCFHYTGAKLFLDMLNDILKTMRETIQENKGGDYRVRHGDYTYHKLPGAGEDISAKEDGMGRGFLPNVVYWLYKNRAADSSYKDQWEFWNDHLSNQFELKYKRHSNVIVPVDDLMHPMAAMIHYLHYRWLMGQESTDFILEPLSYYKTQRDKWIREFNQSSFLDGKGSGQTNRPYTIQVWPHRIISKQTRLNTNGGYVRMNCQMGMYPFNTMTRLIQCVYSGLKIDTSDDEAMLRRFYATCQYAKYDPGVHTSDYWALKSGAEPKFVESDWVKRSNVEQEHQLHKSMAGSYRERWDNSTQTWELENKETGLMWGFRECGEWNTNEKTSRGWVMDSNFDKKAEYGKGAYYASGPLEMAMFNCEGVKPTQCDMYKFFKIGYGDFTGYSNGREIGVSTMLLINNIHEKLDYNWNNLYGRR